MPLSVRAQQLVTDGDVRADVEQQLRTEYGAAAADAEATVTELDRLFAADEERRLALGDMTGWMVKKAARVGRATSRYFVLRGPRVSYYANEANGEGVECKGVIDLTADAQVDGDELAVRLRLPGRVWELTARTGAEGRAWRRALSSELILLIC